MSQPAINLTFALEEAKALYDRANGQRMDWSAMVLLRVMFAVISIACDLRRIADALEARK